MDGSLWPPRREEPRRTPPAFIASSPTGVVIAVAVATSVLLAIAALLGLLPALAVPSGHLMGR